MISELSEQNIGFVALDMESMIGCPPEFRTFLFLVISFFAEFETNIRRTRQREGIERAKRNGKYKGRKPVITKELKDKISMYLRDTKLTRKDSAKLLNISTATVYRAIMELRHEYGCNEENRHLWR
jgi:DNA invertase Pin-like site-specific DNA recombinase